MSAVTPADSPRPPAGASVVRTTWGDVFAIREFRGLFAAYATSLVGDQLAKIALAILVFERTHDAFLGALTYAMTFLPALVAGPLLGWLADRRPRREVMIACDLGRAALVAVMLIPHTPTALLLALLFAVSFLDPPFQAARSALLPDVLIGNRYPVGQSIGSVLYQAAQIVGFGVGGVLVTVLSPRGALAVDCATFVISATIVRLWSPRRTARDASAGGSKWALITDGALEVARRPLLRQLLGLTAASFALIIATEGLAVSYAAQEGHGDVATGLLTAAVPLGSAVGVALVVRIPDLRRLDGMRLLGVLWALPLVATALQPPVAITCLLWVLTGALGSFQLLGNVLFAQALRPETRGRVFAFAQSALLAAQGVGLLAFGLLARLTSPSDAVAWAGVTGVMVCGFLSMRLRGVTEALSTSGSDVVDKRRYAPVASDPREVSRPEPDDAAPWPPDRVNLATESAARWQVAAVYATSLATIGLVIAGVFAWNPQPVFTGAPRLTWWLLSVIFLAASLMPLHFERAGNSHIIFVTQVPTLLGLFFATPRVLLVGVLVGLGLSNQVFRAPMKLAASRAASAIETLVAISLFHALAPVQRSVDGRQLAAGAIAVVAAEAAGFVFLALVRRLVQPDLRFRDLREPMLFSALVSVTVASVGLLAVLALAANAAAGAILVLVGVLLAAGFRSFAKLQAEHSGLGQLYALQEQMGALVPRGESLFPVLRQTQALLQAADVAVDVPEGFSTRRISVTSNGAQSEQVLSGESAQSAPWAPPTGLSVALRDRDGELGLLRVAHRLGSIRGFNQSDLHLLETLAAHVSDALRRGTLIERLHEAATHDPLTGLLTLSEFMRTLDDSLVRDTAHAVAVLDVARLKDINDSLGHQAGDALLAQVGARLVSVLPADALIARAGGGEFAVAVRDVGQFYGAALVEAMSSAVSGLVQVLDVTIDLRSRIGWLLAPDHGVDAATLVRRAELALDAAKRGFQPVGRFTPDMDVDGRRRLQLVNELRQAIVARELRVVYQPLVTPADGRIVGAEALSRWTHHTLGVISPEEFIGVAEQSGMISDLTDYVLDEALAQTRRWTDEGRDLHVAVNLSARCLADMSLPGRVVDMLTRHRLTPAHLTLEVTETSVAEDPTRALAVLERLRGIGVRLSIDDFGTGYSSLASLKHFPVQEVKLDRSFLVDLDVESDEEAASDLALLGAVVALGHSMRLEIVAEGVETPQAYRRLSGLGIDILQGYYIGRPVPASELPRLIPQDSSVA
jgi:diguanylate cyclase (GGDEF)-like protein